MLKILLATTTSLLLLGCGSRPVEPAGPKPVIKTIALVPATAPRTYSLQILSAVQFFVPIAGIAYASSSAERARILSQRLPAPGYKPEDDLTQGVAEALRLKGYEVMVLKDIARPTADRPDSVELESVKASSDAVLHVYFSDVGVESPRRTTDYLPRVNISAASFIPGNKSYPYDTTIYYGVDASEGKDWGIVAPAQHAYPDFDFMVNNLDRVRADFRAATALVAQRIAEQFHAAVK